MMDKQISYATRKVNFFGENLYLNHNKGEDYGSIEEIEKEDSSSQVADKFKWVQRKQYQYSIYAKAYSIDIP